MKAMYQKDPSVTPHGNLRLYIERHKYTKGQYAGAAPADSSRRGKTHFRVAHRFDRRIVVIFHHCDILTAWEDGTVALNTDCWHDSPTTRAAFTQALHLAGYRGYLYTRTLNKYPNCLFHLQTPTGWTAIPWSEGTTIAPDGTIDNHGAKIKRYVADKDARKEWRAAAQEFRACLPVLLDGIWAAGRVPFAPSVYQPERAALNPEQWPDLARWLAYKCGNSAADAWAHLDRLATETMRLVVDEVAE